jgi:DNA-binding PadR family transcriptional regulator
LARLGEPSYGARIHEEILDRTGRDVSIPAVYVTLKRMERKGLVASTVTEPPDGSRATRDYRILPEGWDALTQSREMMESLWDGLEAGWI